MRIAHLADLHLSKDHAGEALTSLRSYTEQIKASVVSMVVIAGDIWDASMLNVEASGFNRFVDALRDIAEVAPVAMIYGTPSHDTDGSLAVFQKIACRHSITILYPGRVYFKYGTVINEEASQAAECVLFGIPEPRKKYLLAEEMAGKGAAEAAVRDALSRLCVGLGARRREYAGLPYVRVYHGEGAGSVLQNARWVERGTGIAITVDDLAAVGADYYALGHIHAPQQVGALPAYYAGSIYPKTLGETHQAGFNIIELTPEGNAAGLLEYQAAVTRIAFPHPQNLKIRV
jgi:exonuclease SbcD